MCSRRGLPHPRLTGGQWVEQGGDGGRCVKPSALINGSNYAHKMPAIKPNHFNLW